MFHFALDTSTNRVIELNEINSSMTTLQCIVCKDDVIIVGNQSHFAHKSMSNQYRCSSENIRYKAVKLLLVEYINAGHEVIVITCKCNPCPELVACKAYIEYVVENGVADIALFKDNTLLCLFELNFGYATKFRYEKWFEFNIKDVLKQLQKHSNRIILRDNKVCKCFVSPKNIFLPQQMLYHETSSIPFTYFNEQIAPSSLYPYHTETPSIPFTYFSEQVASSSFAQQPSYDETSSYFNEQVYPYDYSQTALHPILSLKSSEHNHHDISDLFQTMEHSTDENKQICNLPLKPHYNADKTYNLVQIMQHVDEVFNSYLRSQHDIDSSYSQSQHDVAEHKQTHNTPEPITVSQNKVNVKDDHSLMSQNSLGIVKKMGYYSMLDDHSLMSQNSLGIAKKMGYYGVLDDWTNLARRVALLCGSKRIIRIGWLLFPYIQYSKWLKIHREYKKANTCLKCAKKWNLGFPRVYCDPCSIDIKNDKHCLIEERSLDQDLIDRIKLYFSFLFRIPKSKGYFGVCSQCTSDVFCVWYYGYRCICIDCVIKLHNERYPKGKYFDPTQEDLKTILASYKQS